MNWMRLLAVGRSIGHVPNQPSPYRVTQGLLPRFGGARRDTRRSPIKAPIPEQAPESAKRLSRITSQRKVTQVPAKAGREVGMFTFIKLKFFGKDPKMNSVEPGPGFGSASAVDVPLQPYPLGRWTLFKNPFVRRVKSLEPSAPVQGELSLDMVKPVRNDLSDSDIEVVPARRTESAALVRMTDSHLNVPDPKTSPSPVPAAWDRVKNQVFGVGSS